MAMFTFFGHSSNLMSLFSQGGNKQQLGDLRLLHAQYIIRPDSEQTTDELISFLFHKVCKQFSNNLNQRYVTVIEYAYQDL